MPDGPFATSSGSTGVGMVAAGFAWWAVRLAVGAESTPDSAWFGADGLVAGFQALDFVDLQPADGPVFRSAKSPNQRLPLR